MRLASGWTCFSPNMIVRAGGELSASGRRSPEYARTIRGSWYPRSSAAVRHGGRPGAPIHSWMVRPAPPAVVVRLSTGLEISFSPRDAQGLETATWEQLREIEIDPPGFGLHLPALDADLYIPALLGGFFGSKRWMAARLGELGGKAKSAAKARASRANGRLGGRPKKVATAA